MLAIIVDDDTLIRVVISRTLRSMGLVCIGFATADEALSVLEPPHPDVSLLMTDVSMPGSSLDGLELARRIIARSPGLPVIVMSGSEESLEAARGIEGLMDVVPKPIAPEALLALARRALGGDAPYPMSCDARR